MLRYIFIFFIFLTSVHAAFQSPSVQLTQFLNTIQTMQADFTQVIYDNHGRAIQTSEGQMLLKRPDRFRWEVKKPIPQLVIARASQLWIYDPDLEQVTIRLVKATSAETPALLLSRKNMTLDQNYIVKYLPEKSRNLQWFSLIPREKDTPFISIQLGFLDGKINQMQLEDQLGHTTLIRFIHVKINISLADHFFVFNVPHSVDVIDETKNR